MSARHSSREFKLNHKINLQSAFTWLKFITGTTASCRLWFRGPKYLTWFGYGEASSRQCSSTILLPQLMHSYHLSTNYLFLQLSRDAKQGNSKLPRLRRPHIYVTNAAAPLIERSWKSSTQFSVLTSEFVKAFREEERMRWTKNKIH